MVPSRLLMLSLLLAPFAAAASDGDLDLRAPTPAMFTGPAAFGDGTYTGPRMAPRDDSLAQSLRRGGRGCPTAPDGGERVVTGSVTTGIGHSSGGGTGRWNAADITVCNERITADGDIATTQLHLQVGQYDGPGMGYGGAYHGGMGGAFDPSRAGWHPPFDPWPGAAPVRRESWSEGRQPWR